MRKEMKQIRPQDILYSIRRHRVLVGTLALAGLVIGIVVNLVFYFSDYFGEQYLITASFAVTSQTETGLFTGSTNSPTSTDIHLAEDMVDAVIYVSKSDMTLNRALEEVRLVGVDSSAIVNNLSMSQYEDTQIVEISFTWNDPVEGIDILTALTDILPDILTETLKIGNVTVVNAPKLQGIVSGGVQLNLIIYLCICGLLIGMGYSVLEYFAHPTLLSPHDIQDMFALETLGEIPIDRSYFKNKQLLLIEDENQEGEVVRQSFAAAAHIVLNHLSRKESKVIYITSAQGQEGKTSIAANLAVQLSNLEKKVLLIDFDVRNPSLGSYFLNETEHEHSLNAYYQGDAQSDAIVVSINPYLDLIPARLENQRVNLDTHINKLVEELAVKYDVVLMDTAPVGLVADTMRLNKVADEVLFIIRQDAVWTDIIKENIDKLNKSGISIMGCIVNSVYDMSRRGYRYGYYSQTESKEKMEKSESKNRKTKRKWFNRKPKGTEEK